MTRPKIKQIGGIGGIGCIVCILTHLQARFIYCIATRSVAFSTLVANCTAKGRSVFRSSDEIFGGGDLGIALNRLNSSWSPPRRQPPFLRSDLLLVCENSWCNYPVC